jgi:hypothetical protein
MKESKPLCEQKTNDRTPPSNGTPRLANFALMNPFQSLSLLVSCFNWSPSAAMVIGLKNAEQIALA